MILKKTDVLLSLAKEYGIDRAPFMNEVGMLVGTADKVLTANDESEWLTGDEEKINYYLADDDLIEDVSSIIGNKEEDGEEKATTVVQTIPYNTAIDPFAISIALAGKKCIPSSHRMT
ncbi:hypothetical protein NPIL_497811 [Nephila pilipes]|uniref:Uncharacterized protein n=1 Tax=Nephila pilipes TaxID=299642 RepID=A0A8X6U6T5_NEPPI|nr:hypothetical protein NPIL_497811 [Nephila pilipes]